MLSDQVESHLLLVLLLDSVGVVKPLVATTHLQELSQIPTLKHPNYAKQQPESCISGRMDSALRTDHFDASQIPNTQPISP